MGFIPYHTSARLSGMRRWDRYLVVRATVFIAWLSVLWCTRLTPGSLQAQEEVKPRKDSSDVSVKLFHQSYASFQINHDVFQQQLYYSSNLTTAADQKNALVIDDGDDDDNYDVDCPFRNSSLYRKIFVYPNHGDVNDGWAGGILSRAGRNLETKPWPWLAFQEQTRQNAKVHYDLDSYTTQFSTELLVQQLMTHPKSCLRTYDPEEAVLFYVPYLPSVEYHRESAQHLDKSTSPYAQALKDILDDTNYTGWENVFGLTSKYWKRKGGADHILVFSMPQHGLWHRKGGTGFYQIIETQKQLKPPIVISVELSTTFVANYPKCAAKNIVVPYPNIDGNWFNGHFDHEANKPVVKITNPWETATPAERQLNKQNSSMARPVPYFYSAGNHGACNELRLSLKCDYDKSVSLQALRHVEKGGDFSVGMRTATFCPCPGGDTPGAKRMFDAILAGCIPIILSYDFVWPFTTDVDPSFQLDSAEFSLRFVAQDYQKAILDARTCNFVNTSQPSIESSVMKVTADEILRLRGGMVKARHLYSWYEHSPHLPRNPLRENVLPTGGAAHALVQALADRADGAKWRSCEEELQTDRGPAATQYFC